MSASTTERINFGTASLFETLAGGNINRVANLQDVTVDFKSELKEAFAEGTFPVSVASGHGSIDISAKSLTINPTLFANALGGVISTGATQQPFIDELYQVPATSTYTVTLTNGGSNKLVVASLLVLATPLVGGVAVPTYYKQVAGGAEVAGQSYSVNASTGVLTFAVGDASTQFQASYLATATTGTRVTLSNSFQNSQKTMQLVAIKRDASVVDAGTASLIFTFPAVRSAGFKTNYQEDNFTSYERTYKAFANSLGLVCTVDFVNI